MTEDIERLAREGMEAFSRGELDRALAGFAPDVVWEVCKDIAPDAAVYHGRDGVRQFWAQWRELFEQFEIEVVECRAVDDRRVLAVIRARGVGAESRLDITSPEFVQLIEYRDGKATLVRLAASRAAALGES